MTKFPKLALSCLRHLLAITVLVTSVTSFGAVPVIISPVPKIQFFDASGRPLAFGCLFSYNSGTTTPLATYTDSTGATQNTNPLILTAGGFAGSTGSTGLFLQAGVAYTIKVVSAGGTNCSLGTTQYTINGIGGGVTVLTTIVPYSPTPSFPIQAQNQLFEITLTGNAVAQPITAVGIIPPGFVVFQITQDASGGHTFTWPANSVGGAAIGTTANQVSSQMFYWDGSVLYATGPGMLGNGPIISVGDIISSGGIIVTGDITAAHYKTTCTNGATVGTFRLCKTDTIEWRNNANSANAGISQDASDRGVWEFAGGFLTTGTVPDIFLGGTTASFPRLQRSATAVKVRLADNSGDAPLSSATLDTSGLYAVLGAEVAKPASPSAGFQKGYFKASQGWCSVDSSGTERCIPAGGTTFIQKISTTGCTTGSSSFDTCDDVLTWPVTFGTSSYLPVCTGKNANALVGGESTVLYLVSWNATTVTVRTQTQRSVTGSFGQINCIGVL